MISKKNKVKKYSGKSINLVPWTLYQGDVIESLAEINSESIDCVVTSPPYFWLRDYDVDGQIGLEETIDEYVDALSNVFKEIYRVLKKEGTVFLNIGDTYYSGKGESHGKDRKSKKRRFGLRAVDKSGGMGIGLIRKNIIGIPWRVGIKLQEDNWVLRAPIIWHKDKCLPEAVRDRPRRSYEFVFMLVKNRKYYFDRKPLITQNIDEDVWTIPPRSGQNSTIDTAPFPDELVDRCLSIGCPEGGVVLDPFAGSGTTMKTSLLRGNPVVGIEIKQEFCKYILNTLT